MEVVKIAQKRNTFLLRMQMAILFLSLATSISAFAMNSYDTKEESLYSQLNRAVIRLEHDNASSSSTDSSKVALVAQSEGTGFFVHDESGVYLVAARHVVERHPELQARVTTWNAKEERAEVIFLKIPRNQWTFHPFQGDAKTHYVDLAVVQLPSIQDREIKAYSYYGSEGSFAERSQLQLFDAVPPTPVLIFGFPLEFGFELAEQRAIGRFGIIALEAGEKFLKLQIEGHEKYAEPKAFLVDTKAFPGNSGSPVMLQIYPFTGDKVKLLGVVIASNPEVGFAVIEPASRIVELIETLKVSPKEPFAAWFAVDSKLLQK